MIITGEGMKLLKLTAILFTALFIYSCEESTGGTDEAVQFLPFDVGNYFIYDYYELDQGFNAVGGTFATDSLFVYKNDVFLGRDAYFLERYRDGSLIDTMIFSEDEEHIYRYFDGSSFSFPEMPDDWYRIFEKSNTAPTWNIYKIKYTDYTVNYLDEEFPANANFTFNVFRERFDSIEVAQTGLRRLQKEYDIKSDRRLEFKIPFETQPNLYDTARIRRTHLKLHRYMFVEGIGFSRLQNDPSRIVTISQRPEKFPSNSQNINGDRAILTRFKIEGLN